MISIEQRLVTLRKVMLDNQIDAYIVPGTDPHAGEYIADYWKEREWICGFDGSVGTAVVTLEKAAVWVDSRYYLQAEDQLKGTGFAVMKVGIPQTPDILPWIISILKSGAKVGINPQMFSMNAFVDMQKLLNSYQLELVSVDLIQQIWKDRPTLPSTPMFIYGAEFAGLSCKEKLVLLRREMKKSNADSFVMSTLDDIAWLFNIRGSDVTYNPVVIAYAIIDDQSASIYVSSEKLTDDLISYFLSENIAIRDYTDIYKDLNVLSQAKRILVDGAKINQSLLEAIPDDCMKINQMSPVTKLKSIKNEVELLGMRKAMIKDGVALTRFFMWLEDHVASGGLTELSIAKKLNDFRNEQGNFYGESFGTIAGYAGHGAIVHYKADEKSNSVIKADNLLLLDSGGQFLEGTTDITRTIALGSPSLQQKIDYTLVLKGHIGIATAIFPVGTRGSQLDVLARKAMWDRGINYGHGTGHGIGHFLNVHEGPQNIRMDENPMTLQPGMFLSNEPGLYRPNEYGIRIENLIHVEFDKQTEFGQFLRFETLTLFPIDVKLIDVNLMTSDEIQWLNAYHENVYQKLSPYLTKEELDWIKDKTKAI